MPGIYIHFPFCIHKCSYCDFYSIENLDGRDELVDAICKEIELRGSKIHQKQEIDTLFIGGGTPSLMKPKHIEQIFISLSKYFDFKKEAELTLECNPGTADVEHFKEYRKFGFNRMSMGVQSFVEKELEFLERIHSPSEVFKAFDLAKACGFENISIDLMFAVPGQTIESWQYSLEKAKELNPEHISAYSLIYEKGTPLYKQYISGKIKVIDEDTDIKLYELIDKNLSEIGMNQYEISNYCKQDRECKHNLGYWSSDEYYAFGPSAHGYLNGKRYWNYRSNLKYKKLLAEGKLPEEGSEILSLEEKIFESIYLGLRAKGIELTDFYKKYSINIIQECEQILSQFESEGYLTVSNTKIKLSNLGYFNSDTITLEIASKIIK